MTERFAALGFGGFVDLAMLVLEEDPVVDREEPRCCGDHGEGVGLYYGYERDVHGM